MSKFTLEIETGNDAFGEPGDDFRAAERRAKAADRQAKHEASK